MGQLQVPGSVAVAFGEEVARQGDELVSGVRVATCLPDGSTVYFGEGRRYFYFLDGLTGQLSAYPRSRATGLGAFANG